MLSVVAMATWDRVLCVSLSGRLRQTRSQTHNENSIYVGKHSPICHLCFKRENCSSSSTGGESNRLPGGFAIQDCLNLRPVTAHLNPCLGEPDKLA